MLCYQYDLFSNIYQSGYVNLVQFCVKCMSKTDYGVFTGKTT
jgi:hypothetical protein